MARDLAAERADIFGQLRVVDDRAGVAKLQHYAAAELSLAAFAERHVGRRAEVRKLVVGLGSRDPSKGERQQGHEQFHDEPASMCMAARSIGPEDRPRVQSERLGRAEHVVDMPVDLYFTPLVAQYTVGIDEKGAPLDTEHLLAVHVLLFDYVELLTELLVRVGQQVEGQGVLRPELLV